MQLISHTLEMEGEEAVHCGIQYQHTNAHTFKVRIKLDKTRSDDAQKTHLHTAVRYGKQSVTYTNYTSARKTLSSRLL